MALSLLPGRCYRRGDQLIRLLGPVYPAMLPETEAARWREVSEAEWNDALARAGADRVGIPTGRTDREAGSHQWAEPWAPRLAGGYATACAGCGVTVVGDSKAAVSMRTKELNERHFPPGGEVVGVVGGEPQVRAEVVSAAVRRDCRHYRAGRLLHPTRVELTPSEVGSIVLAVAGSGGLATDAAALDAIARDAATIAARTDVRPDQVARVLCALRSWELRDAG